MLRITSLFLSICLFSWVMPLGAFIKPSQKKTACGGGRAFHMCTMNLPKIHMGGDSSKVSFDNSASTENAHKSSASSGGDDILPQDPIKKIFIRNEKYQFSEQIFRYTDFISSIDPVPKF